MAVETSRAAQINTAIVSVILLLVTVGLIWFTIFRLLRPLRRMIESMNSLAAGQRDIIVPALTRRDEIGDIGRAVQVFKEQANHLNEITSVIVDVSHNVAGASKEILSGSVDLSHRTEQQASNIQETAASMEQIASAVIQNARNAETANTLAGDTRVVANSGQKVVTEAVAAMSEIETSSRRISEIIGVIDEIAFQTNLLSLNAAVEAARAGDAGKGFAVVASEVGKLSRRSSDAAREIKDLISRSGEHVHNGVSLVSATGRSLTDIVTSVNSVADLVSEIAGASTEQSNSVQEINAAISHLDEMTQQNSALVEESNAATRALEDQASFLSQSASRLKATGSESNEFTVQKAPQSAAQRRQDPTVQKPPQSDPRGSRNTEIDNDWQEF